MSLPLLNRGAAWVSRSSPLASTSRLTLASPNAFQQCRASHIGSAPLYLTPQTTLTIQPFPPHTNPAKPLKSGLRNARSVLVKGPLGEVRIPLHRGVELNQKIPKKAPVKDEPIRYDVSITDVPGVKLKKILSFWGMTRALLQNAIEGVSEGHSSVIRLVGVGYRAAVEVDPTPRTTRLRNALKDPTTRTFFVSPEQEQAYREMFRIEEELSTQGNLQRLVLRLGYSHPVYVAIPIGLTVTVPKPTRIVVSGVDKEAVGLFASQVRSWRPPEPYKGKGVFVNEETIKLKTARKK